jgi:hypothetical protein
MNNDGKITTKKNMYKSLLKKLFIIFTIKLYEIILF